MSIFIDRVNEYLSQMKIKQTYVSFRSGIEIKKLSRILTKAQDVNSADMEKIASALGQKVEFFLGDDFFIPRIADFGPEKVLFYAGEPTERQEKIADLLIQFTENIDEVLSAKQCFLNIARE